MRLACGPNSRPSSGRAFLPNCRPEGRRFEGAVVAGDGGSDVEPVDERVEASCGILPLRAWLKDRCQQSPVRWRPCRKWHSIGYPEEMKQPCHEPRLLGSGVLSIDSRRPFHTAMPPMTRLLERCSSSLAMELPTAPAAFPRSLLCTARLLEPTPCFEFLQSDDPVCRADRVHAPCPS